MNRFESITKPLMWFMAILLAAVVTGCGGSGNGVPASQTVKAITSYSINGFTGTINETAKTIAVKMPAGTTVTALVAKFTTTGVSVKVGTTTQTTGVTPNDFTSSKAYIVTAADGSTATYTVTVTVAVAASAAKAITSYTLAWTAGTPGTASGTITGSASPFAIAVKVPSGTSLTAMVATYVTTGSSVTVVATGVQNNGVTSNNFTTSPVVYTVHAADGTTAMYNVTVTVANPGPAGASPALKTASTYGVFSSADAAVTLVDNSTGAGSLVNGNVGLMNGAGACNGCAVGNTVLNGVIHNGDAAATQAQIDFRAAYTDASTRATNACTLSAFTELAGPQGACAGYVSPPGSNTTFNGVTAPTYEPGLYTSGSTIGLGVNKTIYLDAGNNPDAVFIFQAGSAITTLNGSQVILINGALAKNVWWVAGSDATLGYSSAFSGTVITNGAIGITVTAGSTALAPTVVDGRLFSAAMVSVSQYVTVNVPAP